MRRRVARRGSILSGLGRLGDATADLERAVALLTELAGPDHPITGRALSVLARCASALGHYDQALDLDRRALAISERSLGPDHPEVGLAVFGIGSVLVDLNRPAEALAYHRRALRILEARFSASDPQVAMVHYSMSEADFALGDLDAAAKEARTSIDIYRKAANLASTTAPLYVLAKIDRARGRTREAIAKLDEALAIVEKEQVDDQTISELLMTKGEILADRGARDAARPIAARALHTFSKAPHPTPRDSSAPALSSPA